MDIEIHELTDDDVGDLVNPKSPIYLFERTVVVEGSPLESNTTNEMREWLTKELNLLGFRFHKEFRGKCAGNLGLKWEDD